MSEIYVNQIIVEERVRTTSGEDVSELEESMKKLGLLHPIIVKKLSAVLYKLLAGFRRLRAAKNLGWEKISATIKTDVDELEEIDIEMEENIRRKNLSHYEFSIGTGKRKRIYEELHPETKYGVSLKKGEEPSRTKEEIVSRVAESATRGINKEKIGEILKPAERFTIATAKKFGVSERSIQDHVQVGEAILSGKYEKETVDKYKRGEITHSKMLKIDRERRKKEKKKKKIIRSKLEKEDVIVVNFCKDCAKSSSFNCAYCGKKNLLCNKYKNPLVKKLDAQACNDFEI